MRKLQLARNKRISISLVGLGMATAVLLSLLGAASPSRTASAHHLGRAELGIVLCETDGVSMSWRTENEGRAAAPDGWKVERSHQDSEGNPVVQTFTFVGDEADALLRSNQEYWDWLDTSAERNLLYTYRVRAINADGTGMDGRNWSRNALAECSANAEDQPGISEPQCQDSGVSMFWHTANSAEAPEGWKVERSHQDTEGNWIVQTFTFIGADADALQTIRDDNWDWVDTSAYPYVDYSYRVRAINADGTETTGRAWSRHASTICTGGVLDQPGLSIPRCQDDGISMFWHTGNRGEDPAPDGWKVERRHGDAGRWVVQTFTFIGADADALQTHSERFWDWVDTTADPSVAYTYRVRAIDEDGTDTEDRAWSRRASPECTEGGLARPGTSIPRCQDSGIAWFWHTRNRGEDPAPEGWKVERRHWDSGQWAVRTFTFIGADADALQTHSEKYWDWVDTGAEKEVDYTYRVRAIDEDGSDTEGRTWSGRVPEHCCT